MLNFVKALNTDEQRNLKWGVWPFKTHPKTIMPSYLFIKLETKTGISKVPVVITNLKFTFFFSF